MCLCDACRRTAVQGHLGDDTDEDAVAVEGAEQELALAPASAPAPAPIAVDTSDSNPASDPEAARRALEVLPHSERPRLQNTYRRYIPFRTNDEARTFVAPLSENDMARNYLRKYLASIIAALNDANNTLRAIQQELREVRRERDVLLASATGAPPPESLEEVEFPAQSPSPKRPRYDSPGAAAEDL
uniref:Uncharacterized protein n=1 Tax=Setaria viridis TaxID=4556 RepID=A0A4U6TKP8_SETVI|nr:hypothetical protein SEVIR_8G201500v2 [Setaria viridis]